MQWPGREKQLVNFDDDDEIDASNLLEDVSPQLDEELPVDHVGGSGKIAEAHIHPVRQTYATGQTIGVDGRGALV